MTFHSLFSADKEMVEKDIALQSRIRQLRWITSHHLEAIFDSSNPVSVTHSSLA